MKNVFLWCTTLLVCLLVTNVHVEAQTTATFTMTFPTPASDGANLTTNIVLTSSVVLDTNTLEFDPGDQDSVTFDVPPSVVVYPTAYFKDATEGTKRMLGQHGDLSLDATGKILTISNLSLRYGTNYTVETFGIEPENKIAYNLDQIQSTFNTVKLPHRVRLISIDGQPGIACDETIQVLFNRPITSASTPSGPILTFSRIDSLEVITTSTTSVVPHESIVSSVCQLSLTDDRVLELRSSNLVPGETYYVNVNTSYLNGDSDTDRVIPIKVHSHYTATFEAELTDGTRITSPVDAFLTMGERTFEYGQQVTIATPSFVGGLKFKHWKSTNTAYQGVTTPTVTLLSGCDELNDFTLSAVYEQSTYSTLTIGGTDGVAIDVLNELGERLGGPGTYTLYPVTGHGVTIRATSVGSDFEFSSWSLGMTTPPSWFQATSSVIDLGWQDISDILGPVTLDPISTPKDPDPGNYSLCGTVTLEDGADASVFQWTTDQCDEDTQERSGTIGIAIIDDCYEIYRVGIGTQWADLSAYTESHAVNADLTETGNLVTFSIRKKRYQLRLEYRLVKDEYSTTEVDGDPLVGSNITIEVTRNGQILEGQDKPTGIGGIDPEGKPFIEYSLKCGDYVVLDAQVPEDFQHYHFFQKWRLITGYTAPSEQTQRINDFVVSESNANFTDAQTGLKEVRARANFYNVFRIEQVGLWLLKTNGNWEFEWLDVDKFGDLLPDEPVDGRQVKYFGGLGTEVHCKFNMAVDQNSLVTPWEQFVILQRNSSIYAHFDHDGQSAYFPKSLNVSFYASGAKNANVAKVYIASNDRTKWASKMSLLDVNVGKHIKSSSGVPLDANYSFPFEMQMPDVEIEVISFKCIEEDGDPFGDGEMFQHYFSGIFGPDLNGNGVSTTTASWTGNRPSCGGTDCDDEYRKMGVGDTWQLENHKIHSSVRQMMHHDYVWFKMQCFDADNGELINSLGELITDLSDALADLIVPDPPTDENGNVSAYDQANRDNALDIFASIFRFAGKLGESIVDNDDYISDIDHVVNKHEMWGSQDYDLLLYQMNYGVYYLNIQLH